MGKAPTIKNIALTLEENTLQIRLPETPGDDSYALTLLAHGTSHLEKIPSGENKGRNVTYTNPVQKIVSLGTWDGTGKVMSYDLSELEKAASEKIKGYAVLAQKNGRAGSIIAAGKIEN